MKIALLGYTVPGSGVTGMGLGIGRYVYNLGTELVKMGHEVELVVRDDFKPKESWITTVPAPKISWMLYPFFLKNYVRKMDAEVFNSDYVTTGLPLVWLDKKPNVVGLHDALPFHKDYQAPSMKDKMFLGFYGWSFKQIRDRADAIMMRSEHAKADLVELTGIDEERVFVVSGGVDTEKFFPKKKQKHDKVRIGYFGGLDGRKNVELLLDVYSKIAKERDDVELHVAGGGRNLEKFRGMGLPNAKFYGFIPSHKSNDFLNSLDIFVYPSLGEGFGQAPLEAMAAGLPVLSSNSTSLPEVVGGGGLVAKPTREDFHRELLKLIEGPALRKKIARSCLKKAQSMTWRRCAEDSVNMYEMISR